MTELPASVRYVKNGAGGQLWPDAKSNSRFHATCSSIPGGIICAGDMAAIEAMIHAQHGGKAGATRDANALQTLLDRPIPRAFGSPSRTAACGWPRRATA